MAGAADDRTGRRRPVLRILLLAALGGLVYFKYDAVVQAPAFEKLRHPELFRRAAEAVRKALVPAKPSAPPAYAADSTRMEWTCAAADAGGQDSCLAVWALPSEEARGAVRAALQRARVEAGITGTTGYSVIFQRVAATDAESTPDAGRPDSDAAESGAAANWALSRVELSAGERTFAWTSLPDPSGTLRWCAPQAEDPGHCPAETLPRPPSQRFVSLDRLPSRPPLLRFRIAPEEAVRPVLPGRVFALPVGQDGWLKVHHGGTLFSFYAGLARIRPGLSAGSHVSFGDTLGFAAAPADSAPEGAVVLRIEKDGLAVDPSDFLGIPEAVAAAPQDSGETHVR